MKNMSIEKYKTLAERYTKALWKIAEENNEIEKMGEELKTISDTISQNPDIIGFFVNPTIKIEDKKDVLENSFENRVDKELYNFLNVLVDKGRMFLLSDIQTLYFQKIAEKQNILDVEVQSVIELDDTMKNLLSEKLKKITGMNINIINTLDADIIGGVVLRFGGNVIDGSVRTQLKRMQKQLI
ncbi:MAG: ATP synthase F1 subunit delta [bacterium]|nr:ATP synthase F1 subunit delta [bacterium]